MKVRILINRNLNKKTEEINFIEEKIKGINPLEMTPMDAINFLYEIKKELKEKR